MKTLDRRIKPDRQISWPARCALGFALMAAFAASPVSAFPFDPADGNVDLGDRHFLLPLDSVQFVVGNFSITGTGVGIGDVLTFSSTITVTPPPSYDSFYRGALLAITSIRSGGAAVCEPGGFSPRYGMSFDRPSVTGGTGLFSTDPVGPGTLCDSESLIDGQEVPFATIQFVGTSFVDHAFSFDMVLTEAIDLSAGTPEFFVLKTGYEAIPEPGTMALLGLGFGALALRRRQGCTR